MEPVSGVVEAVPVIAALLLTQAIVPVTEQRVEAARETILTALLPLPKGERPTGTLRRAVAALRAGARGYRTPALLELTEGRPRIWMALDHIGIQLTVPNASAASGAAALHALVYDPLLPDEEAIPDRSWYDEWTAFPIPNGRLPLAEAWRWLLDRTQPVVVARGSFAEGAITSMWASQESVRERRRPRDAWETAWPPAAQTPSLILAGPATPLERAPILSLAIQLLGAPKSGALFRVAREELGVSYRQEAWLASDPDGVRGVVYLTSSEPISSEVAERLRVRLRESVESWTEGDRERALGAFRADLEGRAAFSSWLLWPYATDAGPEADRAFREAYWLLKSGRSYDPEGLRRQAEGADLDAIRRAALEIVDGELSLRPAAPGGTRDL